MTEALTILCGGRSRRMGSDKALLTVDGETLLARHIRLARDAGLAVYVAAGGTEYDLPAAVHSIADALPEREGPLSALAGALSQIAAAGYGHTLLMPVDTLVTPAQLRAALSGDDHALFTCIRGNSQPQPLFAKVSVALLPQLRTWLDEGARRMMPLAALPGVRYVALPADWPQPLAFNTPQDWQIAQSGDYL